MAFHERLNLGQFPEKYRKTVGEFIKLKFKPGEFKFSPSSGDLNVHGWWGSHSLLNLRDYSQTRRIEQIHDPSFPDVAGSWTRSTKKDSTQVFVRAGTVKIDGKTTQAAQIAYTHSTPMGHGTDATMFFSRVGDKFYFCWGNGADFSSVNPEDTEKGTVKELQFPMWVSEQSNQLLADLRKSEQDPSKLEEFLFMPFEAILDEHWMHGLGGFNRFKKMFG